MNERIQIFSIWRGEDFEQFSVPIGPRTTVLEALEYIRITSAPDLLYRHSCHHGSCGTCGMLICGKRRLACLTNVASLANEAIEVRPLTTMQVIGDLAIDPERLFADFPADATYLRTAETTDTKRFEDCIECGLCMSACPVTRRFMGPAALAAYHRELQNRPERTEELLSKVDLPEGVWGCDRALSCSAVCPTGVYPAKHIAQLQRLLRNRREGGTAD